MLESSRFSLWFWILFFSLSKHVRKGLKQLKQSNISEYFSFLSNVMIGSALLREISDFFRFNCGTGAAQIVSESRIVVGQWHTVTIFRDGMSGWLRMDNDTPISGRSQVTTTRLNVEACLLWSHAASFMEH